jgi:hypothetical protein
MEQVTNKYTQERIAAVKQAARRRFHICAGTGLAASTSAPGLGYEGHARVAEIALL